MRTIWNTGKGRNSLLVFGRWGKNKDSRPTYNLTDNGKKKPTMHFFSIGLVRIWRRLRPSTLQDN